MPRISSIQIEQLEYPLRRSFATARDHLTRQVSQPIRVTIHLECGLNGCGEAVPVTYVTGETRESVLHDIQCVSEKLVGHSIDRRNLIVQLLKNELPESNTARAAIEIALYRAFAESAGIGLWETFGGAQYCVETDVTIAITADAVEHAEEKYLEGFRLFKIKVGSANFSEDVLRIQQINQIAPDAILRIDANQAFEPDAALRFIDEILSLGINLQLVEQPVAAPDYKSLEYVAERSPVPIFADEAVKSSHDAIRLVSTTSVHGINVKLMKSGVSDTLAIIDIARAANRQIMIGCMLETVSGIGFAAQLAAGTGKVDFLDLDSHMLLDHERANPWFTQAGPRITLTPRQLIN